MKHGGLAIIAALVLHSATAGADRGEMSVYVHLGTGLASTGDAAIRARDGASPGGEDERSKVLSSTERPTDSVGLGSGVLRVTYATHDWFAYEASVSFARTTSARFADVTWRGADGDMLRAWNLGRVQAGARARLGARYIPTIHGFLGGQLRSASRARFASDYVAVGPEPRRQWELIAGVGVGLDYRLSARWLVGGDVTLLQAFDPGGGPEGALPLRSLEGAVYVGYAWYPRY